MLPTTPPNLTAQGTILGTFQYMAPEQLEGKEADARADLFAFGAVLYEMLTGRKAFSGGSHASLISSIMSSHPPPVSAVMTLAPAALDQLIARCLAKDPEDRWQSARDVKLQLAWIAESPAASSAPAVAGRTSRERVAWVLAALMLVALLGSLAMRVTGRRDVRARGRGRAIHDSSARQDDVQPGRRRAGVVSRRPPDRVRRDRRRRHTDALDPAASIR